MSRHTARKSHGCGRDEQGLGDRWSEAGEACLDEVFLEQDLDDLLEDGQQPRVVHTHPTLQHWQQRANL